MEEEFRQQKRTSMEAYRVTFQRFINHCFCIPQNVNLSMEITQLKEEISKLKDDKEKTKKNSSKKLEQAVQESRSKQNLVNEQNKNLEMEIEVKVYLFTFNQLLTFLMFFFLYR